MSIGSTIKKLRREHDMTQEQLAEYLGITANAVSQWECDRTAPDISQLPVLANIFDITTDQLLEVDILSKKSNIENIHKKAWALCNSGDKKGAVEIIREELPKYPNNYMLMSDLTVFLYQLAFQQKCTPQEHFSLCSEAARYIDRIIIGCDDIKIKGTAIELACSIFPAINRYDDALKLIDTIPDTSKDEILTALYSGDKLIEHVRNMICKSVSTAADQTIWLASLRKEDGSSLFDDEQKIVLYEKAVTFYKNLYENGDYYFDAESLAEAEKHIADIWAQRKNPEEALCHLEECARYVVMFDTYDESKVTYNSIIPFGRLPVGINWNHEWNKSHEMLMRLDDDSAYDFLKNHPRYKTLIEQLTQIDALK